jgi:hypothetical protein
MSKIYFYFYCFHGISCRKSALPSVIVIFDPNTSVSVTLVFVISIKNIVNLLYFTKCLSPWNRPFA